jgi:hypothetical protein
MHKLIVYDAVKMNDKEALWSVSGNFSGYHLWKDESLFTNMMNLETTKKGSVNDTLEGTVLEPAFGSLR